VPDVIVLNPGYTYDVFVLIQDGTEFVGSYTSLKEARKEWVKAQKVLNNVKRKVADVLVLNYGEVAEYFPSWGKNMYINKTSWVVDKVSDIFFDDEDDDNDWTVYSKPSKKLPSKKKKVIKKPAIKKPFKKPEVIPVRKKIDLDLD